jgi:hypothetical protein
MNEKLRAQSKRTRAKTVAMADALAREERKIERGLAKMDKGAVEVGTAMRRVHDDHLYVEVYGTFEAYVLERWGMDGGHGYLYMRAAPVLATVGPVRERHLSLKKASLLAPFEPDEQRALAAEIIDKPLGEATAIIRTRQGKTDSPPPTAPPSPAPERSDLDRLRTVIAATLALKKRRGAIEAALAQLEPDEGQELLDTSAAAGEFLVELAGGTPRRKQRVRLAQPPAAALTHASGTPRPQGGGNAG